MNTSITYCAYNDYLAPSLLGGGSEDAFNRLANEAEEALIAYNNDVSSGQSTAISGPVMIAALQKLAAYWGMSEGNPGTPPKDPVELKIYNQLISHCVADSTSTLSDILFGDQTKALALFAEPANQNLFMKDSRGSDSIYNDIDSSGNVTNDKGNYDKEIKSILDMIYIYENDPLNPTAKEALAESIGIQLGQLGNDLKNGFPDAKPPIPPATDGFLTGISLMLNANCTVSGTTQTLLSLFTSSTSTPAQIQAALDSGAMSDFQQALKFALQYD